MTRCGIVGVAGLPNAGKSTLVNALVGTKISIVSRKAQTTRTAVRGIFMEGDAQVILQDAPGLFQPKARLEKAMMHAAMQTMQDADVILAVMDTLAPKKFGQMKDWLERAKIGKDIPVIAVLTKIDALAKTALLPMLPKVQALYPFSDIFLISSTMSDGVPDLRKKLAALMPEGPYLFPTDEVADMPAKLLAAELTREKMFHFLHDEIPYGMHIVTELLEQRPDGSMEIRQRVIVGRDTHKGMVIGKGGQTLKKIGAAVREEMLTIWENPKIHLFLEVAVDPNWSERRDYYALWGLSHQGT